MTVLKLNTPVVFIIFNRPQTTERVFEEIRRAKPPKLLVIADGPRDWIPGEVENCIAARNIINRIDWCCEVMKNYSDINLGTNQRIISGLNWVFENVTEAIILEDDCLPNISFFYFCNTMLDIYRNDDRVMMIGGTNYLLNKLNISESYLFSRYFAIWGWATWRRAWLKNDSQMVDWPRHKMNRMLNSYYPQEYMVRTLTNIFDKAYSLQTDVWSTPWYYSCLINNALSIVPCSNLISNIGIIGTHSTKCTEFNYFPTYQIDIDKIIHPCDVKQHHIYDDALFNMLYKKNLFTRLFSKLRRLNPI